MNTHPLPDGKPVRLRYLAAAFLLYLVAFGVTLRLLVLHPTSISLAIFTLLGAGWVTGLGYVLRHRIRDPLWKISTHRESGAAKPTEQHTL